MKYISAMRYYEISHDELPEEVKSIAEEAKELKVELDTIDKKMLDEQQKKVVSESRKKLNELDDIVVEAVKKIGEEKLASKAEQKEQPKAKQPKPKQPKPKKEEVKPVEEQPKEEVAEKPKEEAPVQENYVLTESDHEEAKKVFEQWDKKQETPVVPIEQKIQELKKEVKIAPEKFDTGLSRPTQEEEEPEVGEVAQEEEEFEKQAEIKNPKKGSFSLVLMGVGAFLLTWGAVNFFKERR